MLLPSTHSAAVLLLILSFLCLGSWANTFKLAGQRWRFELFYFDFAAGAILLALLAAVTLGTQGSEMSFNDRIAVAGMRSQALAIGGGFLFNLGNMLLLAAVSLTGMALSYPVVIGLSVIVGSLFSLGQASNLLLLSIGLLLLLAAVVVAAVATNSRKEQGTVTSRQAAAARARKAKALLTGTIGGLIIGVSYPVAENALWGDLGLGAYAGTLMFCIGIVISTAVFNVFFMNIAIEGERLAFSAYLRGGVRQHTWGLAGGAIWAGGMLAALLGRSVPESEVPAFPAVTFWTYGSVLLAIAWGVFVWQEFKGTGKNSKTALVFTAAFFAAGLVLLSYSRH